MMAFLLSPLGRWIIGVGAALAVILGAWLYVTGLQHEAATAKALAANEAVQIVNLQAQAKRLAATQAITDQSASQYAAQYAKLQADNSALLLKVKSYVSPKADAACVVNNGLIRLLHDAAGGVSANPVPAPAPGADDAASGVALSTIGATGVQAIGAFNANAAELTALQDWIRQQEQLGP